MTDSEDRQLLEQFARQHSQSAFTALVERHVNLVYSVAWRATGNAHTAQEITQAVFIILAQKAGRLPPATILPGWLHQTARLTAANFLRGEIRRQKREQEAYMQSTLNQPEPEVWPQIAPLLDDALDRLGARDRDAIVLRFFENKSLREVGQSLGASEDAAKMRVSRALEKLRKIFARRGVTLTAALIAGAVAAHSAPAAPAGLAQTISAVAFTQGAAAGTSTLTLVKGALKLMAWTKAKTALVAGAGLLLATGTTTLAVKQIQRVRYDDARWDTGRISSRILDEAPPIVRIIPAKRNTNTGWASNGQDRILGLGEPLRGLVQAAYQEQSNIRTVCLAKLPAGKYDFIANLPTGSSAALQKEVRKQFGIAGRFETVATNVLFLQLAGGNGPGLKPTATQNMSSSSNNRGELKLINAPAGSIAGFLESELGLPVIDQTGLKGSYDVTLRWAERNDPQHDHLKAALRDQLGMKLAAGTAPVRMLFVEEAE